MSRHRTYFSRQPERLQAYLDGLTRVAGHADRVVPIENYTKGLMLPIERKSVEPMAARLAPGNVRQMHQSLHHIVADAPWSDDALLEQVRRQVLPAMTKKHKLAGSNVVVSMLLSGTSSGAPEPRDRDSRTVSCSSNRRGLREFSACTVLHLVGKENDGIPPVTNQSPQVDRRCALM